MYLNVAVNITARGILDLTNDETLNILEITTADLVFPTDDWERAEPTNWSLTQRIGLAAWDAPGIDGILAPSALPADCHSSLVIHPVNLVLFMHEQDCHLPRSSSVQIEIEDEFVQLTKLFWTHRPKWLILALERHEPEAAKVLKSIGK